MLVESLATECTAILPISNFNISEFYLVTTNLQIDGSNLATLQLERRTVIINEILATYDNGELRDIFLWNNDRNILGVFCNLRKREIFLCSSGRSNNLCQIIDGCLFCRIATTTFSTVGMPPH